MNYEDRVTKAAVEAAIEGVKLEYVTGSYTGNNTTTRTISLGFTPKVVFLVQKDSLGGSQVITGGIALPDHPMYNSNEANYPALAIVENGFQVGWKTPYIMTNSNAVYYYVAFK